MVLLCKKCHSRVESSEICSYCFQESSGDDCFRCCQCNHCIHELCFLRHRAVPPWSFSCLGKEFSVCIDCWLPKQIASNRESLRRSRDDSKSPRIPDPGSPRVLNMWDCREQLEDHVKDANCVLEGKIEAAARARELAVAKAAVATRAVQLANDALHLFAKRDENIAKNRGCDERNIVGDEEFAIQLHRAMNSSPRISKNSYLLKARGLSAPKMRNSGGDLLVRLSNSGGADLSESEKLEVLDGSTSGPSVGKFSVEMDHLKPEFKVYARTRRNGIKFGVEFNGDIGNLDVRLKEEEGSCSTKVLNTSGDDNAKNLSLESCENLDKSSDNPERYFIKYKRKLRLEPKPGSYFIKYHRKLRLKSKPKSYVIKYQRKVTLKSKHASRSKCLRGGCPHEVPASVSDVSESFQSCSIPVHFSPCRSHSSGDQS